MFAEATARASFSLALLGIPERDCNALISGFGIPPPICGGGIPGIPGGGPPIIPGIVGGIMGGI